MSARWGLAALATLVAVALLVPATAYPDPQRAPYYVQSRCATTYDRHFVYDFAQLLDAAEGDLVEERACALYAATSAHLVLATVETTEGQSIDTYATHMFEAWGIGSAAAQDGLLVLYAQNDTDGAAAVRIEVGYGLEATANAPYARFAVESMQRIKAERIANGSSEADATGHALAAVTAGMADDLASHYTDGHPPKPVQAGAGVGFLVVVALVVVGLGLVVVLLGVRFRGGGGMGGFGGGRFGGGGLGGGGFGGGGFGGGSGGRGGGGFGGGRSGGGGWGGKLAPRNTFKSHAGPS